MTLILVWIEQHILGETGGSELISIGDLGYVNTDSNLGKWFQGKDLLNKFMGSLKTYDFSKSL
jgi:predicted alpha/beta hydrolase family esterase